MARATAYEGAAAAAATTAAARTEGADTATAEPSEAARGGGNMAAGQSVSNRRAERSSYAVTWRARRHGAVPHRTAPLPGVANPRTGPLRPSGIGARARANTSALAPMASRSLCATPEHQLAIAVATATATVVVGVDYSADCPPW